MLESWVRRVIRRRKIVFGIWLVILSLGTLSSTHLNSHLSTSLVIPGSSSAKADSILSRRFGENIEGTFTVIYHFKNANSATLVGLKNKIASATRVIPGALIAQERALSGNLFANITTPLSLSPAASFTLKLRQALLSEGLSGVMVTGPPAIKADVTPVLTSDLHRGEVFGFLIAFALLLLVLGWSREVLVPLIYAAGSISAAISIIYLIAQKFLVVLYVPNIVELIGLGLAIDYSLLLVFRFRTEISKGANDSTSAVIQTMATAGKTVALSSLILTIALSTLTLIPIPFVRSLGISTALVPLISLATAFTLQPALLYQFSNAARGRSVPFRSLRRVGELIVRKPLVVAISSFLVLITLALPVLSLHVTPSSLTAIPDNLESERALSLFTSAIGPGVITPSEIVIDLGGNSLGSSGSVVKARANLTSQLVKNPEVAILAGGIKAPYIDSTGRFIRIFVIGHHSFGDSQSRLLVRDLRSINLATYGFPATSKLYIGGAPAQGVDLLRVLSKTIPWVILLALLLTFALLVSAFKSIILPLKAIALDLISLTVAYGIVVFAFGNHFFSKMLGIFQLHQIEAWSLVFLFVMLFGVSMDYEIFMISRIKEAKDRGLSNSDSIVEGITQTGIVVTTAALIFVGAVSGLVLGHFAGLQEIGVGLAFGVLIDATIVRGLLLPSVMVLLGDWNWWLPSRSKGVHGELKTSPTPLEEVSG